MIVNAIPEKQRKSMLAAAARIMIAVAGFCVGWVSVASAYVGKSFMEVPGVSGDWQGAEYKNWVSIEANYWKATPFGNFARQKQDWAFYSYPTAPRQGAGELVISLDKHNPILAQLMDMCVSKAVIPELTYAESSLRARAPLEVGPRPADIPDYFEFKLRDAKFSDCPVVANAPEQAIVVSFKDIQWRNFHAAGDGRQLTLEPAQVKPDKASAKTKSFVVTWFAPANDVSENQCEAVSTKPSENDYYAFMSKEESDQERVRLASKGGPTYPDGVMCFRGPHRLNACLLPGIVPDPIQPIPRATIARGLNLDGDDGRGAPPAASCKHTNYVSPDGRTGIDNQLYTVEGCMPGYMGHKGMLHQYANEQRRNGALSMLIQINGIDNEKNDNNVDIRILYSLDPMAKDAGGKHILDGYTFRVTDKPVYAYTFAQVRGRIVNGVIIADAIKQLKTNLPYDTPITLHNAALRVEILPDGSLKGVLGGYQDWRVIATANGHSQTESLFAGSINGMYGALKRAADGFKDPVSGECNEISSAYDIEGVPAFIAPAPRKATTKGNNHQLVEAEAQGQKAR